MWLSCTVGEPVVRPTVGPASNMDPYVVTGKIMETCVLPDCK